MPDFIDSTHISNTNSLFIWNSASIKPQPTKKDEGTLTVRDEPHADDSDYYTPEEPAAPLYSNTLFHERPNTAPPSTVSSALNVVVSSGVYSVENTPLRHPLGASLPGTPLSHLSTRSSGDSYSSSSSTRQLLTVVHNIEDTDTDVHI